MTTLYAHGHTHRGAIWLFSFGQRALTLWYDMTAVSFLHDTTITFTFSFAFLRRAWTQTPCHICPSTSATHAFLAGHRTFSPFCGHFFFSFLFTVCSDTRASRSAFLPQTFFSFALRFRTCIDTDTGTLSRTSLDSFSDTTVALIAPPCILLSLPATYAHAQSDTFIRTSM